MEDFLPILHQVERDFRELDRTVTIEYPQARLNMKNSSARWCTERLGKEVVDTITYKSPYQRTEINTDKVLFSELMLKIESLVRRLRENIPILAAGGLTEKEFIANFGPTGAAQLFTKQIAFDHLGPNGSTPDPYIAYNDLVKEIRNHIDFYDLVQVLHSHLPDELAITLFELTKGIPQKELPPNANIPNWSGMENCLRTVQAFRLRLEKEKKLGKSPIEPREFDYLLAKLNFVQLMIFNSTENRRSKNPKVVRNLDLDLAPYIVPPEKILVDFFSSTDYVMRCFRNVLKLMGYEILPIEGDGNCFFRAAVKAIFPNVPRDWEDSLSLMVRKSLNKGMMQKALETGQEYPYSGFVINNVNDSVTMANTGVWADHIQVQKLAHKLQRPIWLVIYDDIQLQKDLDGNLIPGKDYIIGDGAGIPLVLYFTPSPGHYEVLVPQNCKEFTMSDHMKVLENIYLNFQKSGGDFGTVPPSPICAAFFKIAEEALRIREIGNNLHQGQAQGDLRAAIVMDIQDRSLTLIKNMKVFWSMLNNIGPRYTALRNDPREFIYLEVIETIFKDAMLWNGDSLVQLGQGPLSQLYTLVYKILTESTSPSRPQSQQNPYPLSAWWA